MTPSYSPKILFFTVLFLASIFLVSEKIHAIESFCPGGSNPDSRVLFCEDWDGTDPLLDFPNTRGSSWNGWEVARNGDPGEDAQGFSELSTVIRHSGARAFHQVKRANEYFVKDLLRSFPATQEFRMRFYVYFDDTWASIGSDGEVDNGLHFIFLQSALSGVGVRMDLYSYTNRTGSSLVPDLIYAWPPTCVKQDAGSWTVFFEVDSPSSRAGDVFKGVTQGRSDLCFNIITNRNRWIPVEWAYKIVDADTAYVSLWVDGVQRMDNELLPPDPNRLTISWMDISGFMSWLRAYDLAYYMDDIVVANDYAMDLGGTGIRSTPLPSLTPPLDTTPPQIPQNVIVE